MEKHITDVSATIEKDETRKLYVITYDGKTSKVSSGGAWGGCFSETTFDESLLRLKELIISHNEWCDSIEDAHGKVIRNGEIYKTKLIVNGKKVILDNSKSLLVFFNNEAD